MTITTYLICSAIIIVVLIAMEQIDNYYTNKQKEKRNVPTARI